MKRLKSCDDLDSFAEKNPGKDPVLSRTSSSHRVFYHKSETVRKGLSSSSARYYRDRSVDEDREGMRLVRKRSDHDFEGFDRRKGFDRFRDSGESRGYAGSSGGGGGGGGGGGDRIAIHRSESYSGSRREYPKGFRSERDRSRREGSVSSWRRFGSWNKDVEEGARSRGGGIGGLEERGSLRNSPKGLRDVKSPSISRDSGSEQSKLRASPSLVSKGVRAQESKSKSPTWSKDSESEHSKSVEVKKGEDLQVESGNNSEMEEGELEPDPDAVPVTAIAPEPEFKPGSEPVPKSEPDPGPEIFPDNGDKMTVQEHMEPDNDQMELETENQVQDNKESVVREVELLNEGMDPIKAEQARSDDVELSEHQNESIDLRSCARDELNVVADEGNKLDDSLIGNGEQCNGVVDEELVETSVQLNEECKQNKGIDLEVKENDFAVSNKELVKEVSDGEMMKISEALIQNYRDKGKSVAVSLSPAAAYSVDDGAWTERENGDAEICRDNDMEGPSTRGFELFTSSPVRKQEKVDESGDIRQRDEKLTLEPLDLSLSLPNVLLPIGASADSIPAPASPSQARSVQSLNTFCTNSDGFAPSMSFSGSHSFFHNPSCSLNQNSMDNFEQSVGSRPIFQGIDQASQGTWQGQSQNESKQKELPLYQRILMNGNGCLQQSQALHGISNIQTIMSRHPCEEESSKVVNGLERQLSFHKQLVGHSKSNDDVRIHSLRADSHDGGITYNLEQKRVMKESSSGSLYRTSSFKEQEKLSIGGADFIETVVARLISEPVNEMSKKFHEMTGQFIAHLKANIHEMMTSADKRSHLYAIQRALQNRSDITMDMLLKCHRVQLEILVGLKTGLPDFLKEVSSVGSSDLAEIFLNLRCRNLTCRNSLPVDECDCKVCALKNGFCSACMCLVCSKFDMASNTCSWVGCDVCLHWCHVDCALRESYIRNGRSATGDRVTTEMQSHCVACDHPSEMFGFVKEVFQNFAKDWAAETLSRELEYVKRIFSASKDVRGKQLREVADHMLARLANKSNLPEVYAHIMTFIADADSSKLGKTAVPSGKDLPKSSNGISGPSQEAPWLKSVYSEKVPQLERSASALPSVNFERNDKRVMEPELQTSSHSHREPLFDELDSIVRMKLAEAKMFQAKADDARREAEGLKRIAIAKSKKIDEEYTSRIGKLRLAEAEDMRTQKIDELQALERAHREYASLKVRMEADIKDLLLKMEATKRNLPV